MGSIAGLAEPPGRLFQSQPITRNEDSVFHDRESFPLGALGREVANRQITTPMQTGKTNERNGLLKSVKFAVLMFQGRDQATMISLRPGGAFDQGYGPIALAVTVDILAQPGQEFA